jgi:RES domain-containing protein
MRLWRLTRVGQTALDGAGALKHGGRYSPPGAPVVNFASEAGLAVLVSLRYLSGDLADAPDDYVLGAKNHQTDQSLCSAKSQCHERRYRAAISSPLTSAVRREGWPGDCEPGNVTRPDHRTPPGLGSDVIPERWPT